MCGALPLLLLWLHGVDRVNVTFPWVIINALCVQEAVCCNIWPSRGESSPHVLAWCRWRVTGRNWTHRHTGILLIYIAHVAMLVGVGGGGGLSVNLTRVRNGAEINKGYRQEEPTEVVAPETPLCHGLPQAFPVCKLNHCTSPSIDPIKLWAPVSPLSRPFPQAACVNRLNRLQQEWSEGAGSYSEFTLWSSSVCPWTQYRPKQQRLNKVGSVCGPLCCSFTRSLLVSWLNWCRVQQAAMIQWKWKNFWLPVC
jgi:hypothetical protein